MKKLWITGLVFGFSIALIGCVENEYEIEAEYALATGMALLHQTQTAAAWTSTPRPIATTAPTSTTAPTATTVPTETAAAWTPMPSPTATTAPTATTVPTATTMPTVTTAPTATPAPTATLDPSVYGFPDPAHDCGDYNDQPIPCWGPDILRVWFQAERPSIPPPPHEPPQFYSPLTWVVIGFNVFPDGPPPDFELCVSIDLDADTGTGAQFPSGLGADQVHCYRSLSEDIVVHIWGADGEFVQNAFPQAAGVAWMADGTFVMGIASLVAVDPNLISEFVPVGITVCSVPFLSCDYIKNIEFAPAGII